jgi:hypothetical protein
MREGIELTRLARETGGKSEKGETAEGGLRIDCHKAQSAERKGTF